LERRLMLQSLIVILLILMQKFEVHLDGVVSNDTEILIFVSISAAAAKV